MFEDIKSQEIIGIAFRAKPVNRIHISPNKTAIETCKILEIKLLRKVLKLRLQNSLIRFLNLAICHLMFRLNEIKNPLSKLTVKKNYQMIIVLQPQT